MITVLNSIKVNVIHSLSQNSKRKSVNLFFYHYNDAPPYRRDPKINPPMYDISLIAHMCTHSSARELYRSSFHFVFIFYLQHIDTVYNYIFPNLT